MNDDLLSGPLYVLEWINPVVLVHIDEPTTLALGNFVFFFFAFAIFYSGSQMIFSETPGLGSPGVVIGLAFGLGTTIVISKTGVMVPIMLTYGLFARVLDGGLFGIAIGSMFRVFRRHHLFGFPPIPGNAFSAGLLILGFVLITRSILRLVRSTPLQRYPLVGGAIALTCLSGLLIIPGFPDERVVLIYWSAFPAGALLGCVSGVFGRIRC